MPEKEDTKQTTFLWWDGKQVEISEFITELGLDDLIDDPDDKDCSYEAVYKQNRVH